MKIQIPQIVHCGLKIKKGLVKVRIRHRCRFKVKEEGKEAALKEALERVQTLKEIPGLQRFEVVTNSKEAPESNYEISLIFDFFSIEDLNSYQKDPKHVAFGDFIKSVRTDRACIDYEF